MGADLKQGIPESDLDEGAPLLGDFEGEAVVLVREQGRTYAVGATCTHYGGPLAEGIVARGTIRCPWHHACFDLASGQAHGPALSAIACYDVAIEAGRVRVLGKKQVQAPKPAQGPRSVAIVGAGAAGVACVETLRGEGYGGTITLLSAEGSDPVDRPNLSKDYLAGSAPEEWVYLRSGAALDELGVERVAEAVAAIDAPAHRVRTASGREVFWDALVLAPGAEPVRLPIEGADLPHVHTLRTLADSRAIATAATAGGPAVVIGASFIGLEVAASLRARNVDVTVVGPEAVPLARVLGDEVGSFVRQVHEEKGVTFRLGRKPARITREHVVLDDGQELPAAVVVLGVGVRPRLDLATAAGLTVDRGIVVDEELRAAPGIWAAGDVARYPWDGQLVRIEHWQVAVRHGQAVARSILGRDVRRDVPFFWSQHHDVTLGYVGHAERFDRAEVHGDLTARDAHVVYREGSRIRAIATLGRDRLALEVEEAIEREDRDAVGKLVG